MKIIIKKSKEELGKAAAQEGSSLINRAISENRFANVVLATGASQFEMLNNLVQQNVDWSKVNCFHLDEYIGLTESHPASFRKYLKERFADKVNVNSFYFINGENNPKEECKRISEIIKRHPIDVAFIGIGENGHLAFNDPPADFETEEPYIIVELDEKCRMQQLGEGWFPNLESVPDKAISMSIKQILKSKSIICTVPDKRKAEAVFKTITEEISPMIPATILKKHSDTILFLDTESASLLNEGHINDSKRV